MTPCQQLPFMCAGTLPPPRPMPRGKPNFRVARDAVWLRGTAGRVASVLQAAVPPLSSHPRATVRAAVAEGRELMSGLR